MKNENTFALTLRRWLNVEQNNLLLATSSLLPIISIDVFVVVAVVVVVVVATVIFVSLSLAPL